MDLILDSLKIIESPTLIIQKPGSNLICGGGELKLEYNTTGNYPADNIFTFSPIYTSEINNIQKITKYELGKSTSLSEEIILKIPTTISTNYYQLEVTSSNPNSTKTYEDLYFRVLQLPDGSISGNTTINLGSGTLLSIINNSGGRSQYILSDSIRREMIYARLFPSVYPSKTTTFRILSISNECGIGKSSGSATVIINPRSDKNIEIDFSEQFRFPEQ